jgi:hypothetical protein
MRVVSTPMTAPNIWVLGDQLDRASSAFEHR